MGKTNIKDEIKKRIIETEDILKMVNAELEHTPEGSLKIQCRNKQAYYYHQIKRNNNFERRYIEKKNANLATALAKKGYYSKIKPQLEKELRALKSFDESYNDEYTDNVYDSMINARKQLLEPVRVSNQEILNRWNNENYETNASYPENLVYKTDNGEIVRSKSELIIANMLFHNKKNLKYKYERPLELIVNGEKRIIHPDFTVLNVDTGKITYWEHAGKMDDSKYASSFVWKTNIYLENGIISGENLIYTFETNDTPINTQYVLTMIDKLL